MEKVEFEKNKAKCLKKSNATNRSLLFEIKHKMLKKEDK